MKIIITAKEFLAGVSLITEVAKQLPKEKREKTLMEIRELKAGLITYTDMSETERKAFTERFIGKSDKLVAISLDADLNVVFEHDEGKSIEMMKVIEEEVESFTGMFITGFGLFKMFGSRLKKVGKKIEAIAIR